MQEIDARLGGRASPCSSPGPLADGPGDSGPDTAAAPVRAQPAPPQRRASATVARKGHRACASMTSATTCRRAINHPASEALAICNAIHRLPPGAVLALVARDGVTCASRARASVLSYARNRLCAGRNRLARQPQFRIVRDARALQNRPFEGFAIGPPSPPTQTNWPGPSARAALAPRRARPGFAPRDEKLGCYGVAAPPRSAADQMDAIIAAAACCKAR